MTRVRYLLPFLLLAGVAGVHAQPIVKITTPGGECDVTPTTSEIFHLDASGNVLITGTLSGTACSGSGGGSTVSFTSPLQLGTSSIAAGGSTSLTYTAANATGGCSASPGTGSATPSGSGTCPSLTVSNGSCTGGASCSANGSVSEPGTFASNTTSSCSYSVTATCSPGSVTSAAVLQVTNPNYTGGGSGGTQVPPECNNLSRIGTGSANQFWSRITGTTTVIYGQGGTNGNRTGVDATSYNDIWSPPGTPVTWPGNYGISTRPSASVNVYFAERFTVPTDGSVTSNSHWSWSGSGINTNAAFTISICPGDFGQTGTQITQSACKVNQGKSGGGFTATIGTTPVAGYCTVAPGTTYYLNILPMASLPVSNVSTTSCTGTCTPWLGVDKGN